VRYNNHREFYFTERGVATTEVMFVNQELIMYHCVSSASNHNRKKIDFRASGHFSSKLVQSRVIFISVFININVKNLPV